MSAISVKVALKLAKAHYEDIFELSPGKEFPFAGIRPEKGVEIAVLENDTMLLPFKIADTNPARKLYCASFGTGLMVYRHAYPEAHPDASELFCRYNALMNLQEARSGLVRNEELAIEALMFMDEYTRSSRALEFASRLTRQKYTFPMTEAEKHGLEKKIAHGEFTRAELTANYIYHTAADLEYTKDVAERMLAETPGSLALKVKDLRWVSSATH